MSIEVVYRDEKFIIARFYQDETCLPCPGDTVELLTLNNTKDTLHRIVSRRFVYDSRFDRGPAPRADLVSVIMQTEEV